MASTSAASDKPSEASVKGVCWSITINNPTAQDFEQWEALKGQHWVREVIGQVEKGDEGTVHIQGCLKTLSVRFAQVKKALPRAHIEKARSEKALERYAAKEDTRVARIQTTKVATHNDLQRYCLTVALRKCYQWRGADPLTTDEQQLLVECKHEIQQNWESILDEAVDSLIYQGYYGVEFVASNPQVRTAFRKYFPAILYRTYNGQNQATQVQDAARSAQSPEG